MSVKIVENSRKTENDQREEERAGIYDFLEQLNHLCGMHNRGGFSIRINIFSYISDIDSSIQHIQTKYCEWVKLFPPASLE